MGLREQFERLGVPEYLLAQVIWAELDGGDQTPKQIVDLARRIFPDGIHEQIEKTLLPAEEPRRPIRDLQERLTRARRIA